MNLNDFFKNLVFSEKDEIFFESGIPGFEQSKKFVLVQIPDYLPFEWLACTDGSKLRFAVINPMMFRPDYTPNIPKAQLKDLGLEKAEDVLLYCIVTIRKNPAESTANLSGPIVINRTKRIGRQIILDDERYGTQETIIKDIQ
jgi:flagellar assembly factor FliW